MCSWVPLDVLESGQAQNLWSDWRKHILISGGNSLSVSRYPYVICFLWRSPGFGLTLVAETVNGTFLGAEVVSPPQGQGDQVLPEELGRNCAKLLLEEIYRVRITHTLTHSHTHLHTLSLKHTHTYTHTLNLTHSRLYCKVLADISYFNLQHQYSFCLIGRLRRDIINWFVGGDTLLFSQWQMSLCLKLF